MIIGIKNLVNEILLKGTPLKLPFSLDYLESWEFNMVCSCCNNIIIVSLTNFKYSNSLSNRYIKNELIVTQLGKSLGLKKVESVNDFRFYNFVLNFKYFGSASIGYFTCPNCNTKFLIAFHEFIKEERELSLNELYVERIVHVEFDHDNFIKMLTEK